MKNYSSNNNNKNYNNLRKIDKDHLFESHQILNDTINYRPIIYLRKIHTDSISPLRNDFERHTPTKNKVMDQKKDFICNNRFFMRNNGRKYNNLNEINLTNNNSLRNFDTSQLNFQKRIFETTIKNSFENNPQKELQLKDIRNEKSLNSDEIIKELQKKVSFLENILYNFVENNLEQTKNNSSFYNNELKEKKLANNIDLENSTTLKIRRNNQINQINNNNKNDSLLNENIQNYENKINELKDKIISSTETINNLMKENQLTKKINKKLNKENMQLKKNLTNIKEAQNNKSNNYNNIANNNYNYFEKINNLENEISKKNEEINNFKLEIKNLNDRLSSYQIINDVIEKLKEENEQLKNKIRNFQNLIFNKNEIIKEMQNYIKNKSNFNLNSNNSDINLIFNSFNNNIQSENFLESEEQLMPSDNEIQQQYDNFKKYINEVANNKNLPK